MQLRPPQTFDACIPPPPNGFALLCQVRVERELNFTVPHFFLPSWWATASNPLTSQIFTVTKQSQPSRLKTFELCIQSLKNAQGAGFLQKLQMNPWVHAPCDSKSGNAKRTGATSALASRSLPDGFTQLSDKRLGSWFRLVMKASHHYPYVGESENSQTKQPMADSLTTCVSAASALATSPSTAAASRAFVG